MTVLMCVICALTGFIEMETGSVIPSDNPVLNGYAQTGTPLPPGEGTWSPIGPWGGNVKALAVSPVDDTIVLAGCGFSMASDAGGVFKSTDGGETWAAGELFPFRSTMSAQQAPPPRTHSLPPPEPVSTCHRTAETAGQRFPEWDHPM